MSEEKKRTLQDIKNEAVQKMKVCLQCEHYKQKTRTCAVCRCFLPAKVLIPGLHCPKDKW
jgi:ribosomal protein L32